MTERPSEETRIASLERELAALAGRMARLEYRFGVLPAAPAREERPSASKHVPRRRPALDLEELLGGRLLALAGGAAVILGVAFFVALAVERGWIGETARITLAFAGSGALLAAGAWLHERRGQTQASLAAVGTAIAALYLTSTAATALYELFPVVVGLLAALAIGAVATVIAVRWDSRTVAALGIVGSLLTPVFVDAGADASLPFLAVALASAVGVLLWRRWDWLAMVAFLVTAPQLAYWTFESHSPAALVVALGGFAALNLVAAVGYELRVPSARLRASSALLASFSALIVGGLGAAALVGESGQRAAGIWLACLALAHAALGAGALRFRRVNHEIGLVLLGAALALADAAFGLLAGGLVLALGWAGAAFILAAAARRYERRLPVVRASVGSQLSLAVGHALLFEAPPRAFEHGASATPSAVSALAAILIAAFGCARLATGEREGWRELLDGLALATLAYVTALTLSGAPLVAVWAAVAAGLAQVARRGGDSPAAVGALAFLALAGGHALMFEAPPRALVDGVDDLLAALLALGAVAVASWRCSRLVPGLLAVRRLELVGLAGVAALYLASVAIVDSFGVRQQGQVLLSAFWSICGLGALLLGLRMARREVRVAGLGLLLLALAKVFLYDLSALDSVYRVLSFVALGLLLLGAAYAYQRAREVSFRSRPAGSHPPS